jgi:iron complex outermembrane recepter protein
MLKKFTLFSGAAMFALSLALTATATNAQNVEPDQASNGDIIVTAQRVETNLQNTPIAITALSGEALAQRGATSLIDVQNFTPSLVVSSRSTTGAARAGFTIRGIGVDSNSSSNAVGLYVDDVYYSSAAGNLLGLFDVERVEVLRGPQGTLFGRNTIAGAVQYISTKPSSELGGFVAGTYGNLDRAEIGGAINLPIGDTLAVRVSGRYDRRGGYVHDILNNVDVGRDVTKQGRVALRWTPTSSLTIDLKGEYLDFENNGRASTVRAFNPSITPGPGGAAPLVLRAIAFGLNRALVGTVPVPKDRYSLAGYNAFDGQVFDYRTVQGKIVWDVTDSLTIKSISAYSKAKDFDSQDVDLSPLSVLGGSRGHVTSELFTQELQLIGSALEDKLHYTLGGYYYDESNTVDNQFLKFGTSALVLAPTAGDFRTNTLSKALYGQLTFDVSDQLSVTGGLRYSRDTVEALFLNRQAPNPADPANPIESPAVFVPVKTQISDWSPHIGVNFQIDDNKLVYAKASKGFRPGGFNINAALPSTPEISGGGYRSFGAETAWTYEAGTRLQFLDRRIRVNPTVFYTDWKNIQFNRAILLGNPATLNTVTDNAGDGRIWGVELEWQAGVTKALELHGSFSYLNAKYKSILSGVGVTLGSEFQHTPAIKYSLGARYTVPMANDDRLILSADWAWTDEQRSAVSNSDFITQPAYGLLNGRIEYRMLDNKLSLSVYGTNLLDKYHLIGGVNGFSTFGAVENDLGRPREFGISARFNF